LAAYQEVEDSLAALRQLEGETETAAAAVTATATALQQAKDRYEGGIAPYLEVASTETTALQAQLTEVNVETRRYAASVMLVKALGGGWRAAPP
jgi:outer membrane protein TolC